jgi:DNA (cytosine-5)-methyltransferase 1
VCSGAYYNEIDPEKAEWIRQLIAAKVVAPGDVDERDIKLVQPDDLRGYRQCHFFAGIAVWSYALRLAGWPDDREVWTGSCPCGPFSVAGKGSGLDDERHLWPSWFYLIEKRRPVAIFGEQVEAAIKYGWLDLVQDDMEGIAYSIGTIGLPAAGVGAPHIRQRIYFVADAEGSRSRTGLRDSAAREERGILPTNNCGSINLENAERVRQHSGSAAIPRQESGAAFAEQPSSTGQLVYPERERLEGFSGDGDNRNKPGRIDADQAGHAATTGFTRGFWAGAEWINCKDGKLRPVEPGTFPLAHGVTARVLKLRGYGDAINAQVAKAFIEAYLGAGGS